MKTFTRNTSTLLIGNILSAASTFLVSAYAARNLEQSNFASFSLILATVQLCAAISESGTNNTYLIRYPHSCTPNEGKAIFLGSRAFLATIASTLALAYLLFSFEKLPATTCILIFMATFASSIYPAFLTISVASKNFSSHMKKNIFLSCSRVALLFLLGIITFIKAQPITLNQAILIIASASIITVFFSLILALPIDRRAITLKSIASFLKAGQWFALQTLFGCIVLRIEFFLMDILSTDKLQLALYSAAFQLSLPALIIGGAAASVVFPDIAKLKADSHKYFDLERIIKALSLATTLIIAVFIFPFNLAEKLFGIAYSSAWEPAQYIFSAFIISSLTQPIVLSACTKGRGRLVTAWYAIVLFASITIESYLLVHSESVINLSITIFSIRLAFLVVALTWVISLREKKYESTTK